MTSNYYELLGIDCLATDLEIRHAYIMKQKMYHPDLFNGDKNYAEKLSAELNTAYSILSDKEKRSQYDNILHKYEPQKVYKTQKKADIIYKKTYSKAKNIAKEEGIVRKKENRNNKNITKKIINSCSSKLLNFSIIGIFLFILLLVSVLIFG